MVQRKWNRLKTASKLDYDEYDLKRQASLCEDKDLLNQLLM